MEHGQLTRLIKDQKQITACAIEVIDTVKMRRGRPLQTRDRMALKLLTPKNSALILHQGIRHLACRQICFDILTHDLGRGMHRLIPAGVHVYNPGQGWWSDHYGLGQFLWNLLLKEKPEDGMARILERLFKFKLAGFFGPKARFDMKNKKQTITADIHRKLKLMIKRDEGVVETTLRRLVKARAIYLPHELGLKIDHKNGGYVVLLFGKNKRYGISFCIERL